MTSLAGANDPGDMHHQVLHATEAASSSIDNAETLQCASQQGPKCETPQYTGSSTVFIMRYIYIYKSCILFLLSFAMFETYIYKYIELLYRLQDLPRMSQMMKRLHQKLPRKHLTTQDTELLQINGSVQTTSHLAGESTNMDDAEIPVPEAANDDETDLDKMLKEHVAGQSCK